MSTSYIYLIESINDYDTVYKIGYTKNNDTLQTRIKNLQTGNSSLLKLINKFETINGRTVETTLHNLFKHKRLHGEWFKLDIDDVVQFENICNRIENNLITITEMGNPFINK